jgi:alkylhydroperoxidase/carboxymuconolactone decarboxylase family protein YurZ
MSENDPIRVFQQEAPDVLKAYGDMIRSLTEAQGMDPKTRELIYIGIKASQGNAQAIKYHVPIAKKNGATREEVKLTILMTLTTSGIDGVASCLPAAMTAYDAS